MRPMSKQSIIGVQRPRYELGRTISLCIAVCWYRGAANFMKKSAALLPIKSPVILGFI